MQFDPLELTRKLVQIESITGNESSVGYAVAQELERLGYQIERMTVPPQAGSEAHESAATERFNVWATSPGHPRPEIVFSTHMDTVPPFLPMREDTDKIYGRGTCDAKGIIAAQIAASLKLRAQGTHVGLLFVVGEERDSQGAMMANQQARGAKFLVNGEPTENRLGLASKGMLRVVVTARGKMAHSAYPELGESAIEKLLDALQRIRAIPLPVNPEIGPTTLNIGLISGGRAPNVIPDAARAQLSFRLVGPTDELRRQITEAAGTFAEIEFALEIPFVRLRTVDGLPTMIAAYTTDIPALTNWGQPLLLGPGSIHVAHTEREFISKSELLACVDLYCDVARKLI
jgi:acetylornithine deacetylase